MNLNESKIYHFGYTSHFSTYYFCTYANNYITAISIIETALFKYHIKHLISCIEVYTSLMNKNAIAACKALRKREVKKNDKITKNY